MTKPTLLVAILVFSLALVFLAFPNRAAHANMLCVNPDGSGGCYTSIQAAIDAASPGDTIQIAAGTYGNGVIRNKSLTVLGAGTLSTSLNSITIDGSTATLSGFNVHSVTNEYYNNRPSYLDMSNIDIINSTTQGYGILNTQSEITLTNVAVIGTQGGLKPTYPGIWNNGGPVTHRGIATLINVTVSGNLGGGIGNFDSMVLTNVTIANNGRTYAGILNTKLVTITNSIIANSPNNCFNDTSIGATLISQGSNISSDSTCPFNATGDMTSTNPLLMPLAIVGGQYVHMLQSSSPAIDAGKDIACPPTDQTSFARPYGAHCDIGAYEVRPVDIFFHFLPFISR